jgi:inosine/xanthosine triphosphatase
VTARAALASLRVVRVGSTNPPKLAGVRAALAPFAPGAAVEGLVAESGVPDQPVGFAEIARGARNRARAARECEPCDLAVGYEDGLVSLPDVAVGWFNVGCAAVTDGERIGFGLSSGFAYPPACAEPAAAGRGPVGALFDALWREHAGENAAAPASALSVGNIGKLSLGALPRADYTRQAVLCALVHFLHPALYSVPLAEACG